MRIEGDANYCDVPRHGHVEVYKQRSLSPARTVFLGKDGHRVVKDGCRAEFAVTDAYDAPRHTRRLEGQSPPDLASACWAARLRCRTALETVHVGASSAGFLVQVEHVPPGNCEK